MNNCGNYLYPIAEAARQGKPSVVLGVGVDRIKTDGGRLAYSRHLSTTRFLSVRDPLDKGHLVDVNPALDVTFAGIDMAFYLGEDLRRMAAGIKDDGRKVALFSLPIMLPNLKAVAAPMIRELKAQGYEPVILLHSDDDRDFSTRLAKEEGIRLLDAAGHGIAAVARIYASSSLVVTGRYHALILGAIFGKPVVTVNGDGTKAAKLMNTYLPSCRDNRISVVEANMEIIREVIANAKAPEFSEVQRCIATAYMMKEALVRSLHSV
ncbi:polysaccharide pyruvyl transferase family protein [Burkholderia cenocepacia]